uniref:Uncharacterized protein n=1 Tax=Ficus carica TaxID=3494 RepID=A0AA88JEP7_FICCA|nr:hypothetical protein TIFTF001_055398 [Ficus carica]
MSVFELPSTLCDDLQGEYSVRSAYRVEMECRKGEGTSSTSQDSKWLLKLCNTRISKKFFFKDHSMEVREVLGKAGRLAADYRSCHLIYKVISAQQGTPLVKLAATARGGDED